MRARTAAVVLLACSLAAGCATAAPAPPPAVGPAAATAAPAVIAPSRRSVSITFYAAADNDPPGSTEIAHASPGRTTAGGTGTYDDPLTLATDPRELRPGARVYVPSLQRYYVMEDDCAECTDDWDQGMVPHLDLWLADTTDPAVEHCEAALTPDAPVDVVVDPPPGLPVRADPSWVDGHCAVPAR